MLNQFSLEIEKLYSIYHSYIEAIVDFAEEKNIDIDDLVEHLHPNIINKLKVEFIEKNYFPDKKIENSIIGFLDK